MKFSFAISFSFLMGRHLPPFLRVEVDKTPFLALKFGSFTRITDLKRLVELLFHALELSLETYKMCIRQMRRPRSVPNSVAEVSKETQQIRERSSMRIPGHGEKNKVFSTCFVSMLIVPSGYCRVNILRDLNRCESCHARHSHLQLQDFREHFAHVRAH